MSPEENKAVVRRFVAECLNQRNLASFEALIAEDVVNHFAPPGLPTTKEGWRQNFAIFRTAFPDMQWTLDDLIAEGDLVVGRATWRATHIGEFFGIPPTGRRFATTSTHLLRIADGRIVEHWGNGDDVGLLQQLGVIPTPEPAAI
jgi:steroid delta-isomerase-like uncharacterized protein